MTRLPIRTGAIIFALVIALAFPISAQEQDEEPVSVEEIDQLRKRIVSLEESVKELEKLRSEASDGGRSAGDLAEELRPIRNDLTGLRTDLVEIEDNLKNIRENTFENEKRLATIEENYKASARRNLLVAASGIVVGLIAVTLYWT